MKLVAVVLAMALAPGCGATPWLPAPRGQALAGVRAPLPPPVVARHAPSRGRRGKHAGAVRVRGCPPDAVAGVVARVNAVRASARLRPLAADPRLTRAAQARADVMAARNRLSHSGWEATVRGEVAVASALGENVAYNYPTADAVMDGWMRSSGHRENILARSFHRIGVGCVADARAHLWWAQDFAD